MNDTHDVAAQLVRQFGERLAQERREKAARERRDITQRDVAVAVNETPTNYSRWEAGINMPKDAAIAKLAIYFGVTPAWLRYGQEPREAPRFTEVLPDTRLKPKPRHRANDK